jgi:hypothetical protein
MMMTSGRDVLSAMAIGVGASLSMDAWNLFLRLAFGIPSLDYCLLGRWLRHMPSGAFRHASISNARPMPFECLIGWIGHLSIGACLGVGFLFVVSRAWLARPTLWPALLWGVGTVVLPFFVMQPALGLGMAASKTANPKLARAKSLATHTVFGVGLYWCARALDYLVRARG